MLYAIAKYNPTLQMYGFAGVIKVDENNKFFTQGANFSFETLQDGEVKGITQLIKVAKSYKLTEVTIYVSKHFKQEKLKNVIGNITVTFKTLTPKVEDYERVVEMANHSVGL